MEANLGTKDKSIENDTKQSQMVHSANKNFKVAIKNIFKELKKNVTLMNAQTGNLKGEVETEKQKWKEKGWKEWLIKTSEVGTKADCREQKNLSEIDATSIEISQSVEQKEKQKEIWKEPETCAIIKKFSKALNERKQTNKRAKINYLNLKNNQNLPNLVETINLKIQEVQWTSPKQDKH